MLHIKQAVVVEGKYDKIRLSQILDAVIIVTNGFSIYKDKDTANIIRHYAKKTGIIILTDSDTAGFRIRNYIKGIVPDGDITNVFVPDVFGKEKRKDKPSKEGKLGVEGIDDKLIIEAFEKAGITGEKTAKTNYITKQDLYDDGLFGGADSSQRRSKVLSELGLPSLMSTKSLLEILNSMLDAQGYRQLIDKLFPEK